MTYEYNLLPDRLKPGMQRYLEQRIMPGSFIQALLANDLAQSVLRADPANLADIRDIAYWLLNECPQGAWGSREAVAAWCSQEVAGYGEGAL